MRLTVNDIVEYQCQNTINTAIFKWINDTHIGLLGLDGKLLEYDVADIIITNIKDRDFKSLDLSVA